MPGTPTTKYAIPTLAGTDLARDIDTNVNSALTSIDGKMVGYSAGLLGARPTSTGGSPGIAGRRYRATDTGQEFIDTGTSWIEIATSPVQVAQIADAAVTSRKLAPTIQNVENSGLGQTLTGSFADLTGASLAVTPLVLSTIVVQGVYSLHTSGAGAVPDLRVVLDGVQDTFIFVAGFALPANSQVTLPIFKVYSGVSAAAHTIKLQARSLTANSVLEGFRLAATVYAQ